MDEFKLIVMVKKHEFIYSADFTGIKYKSRRDLAWQSVAKEMQLDEADCRRRWKSMRDRFVREFGEGENNEFLPVSNWEFYTQMEFLKEHIKRKTNTVIPKESSTHTYSPTVKLETDDEYEEIEETKQHNTSVHEDLEFESNDLPHSPATEPMTHLTLDYAVNETESPSALPLDTISSNLHLMKLKLINAVKKHKVLYLRRCLSLKYKYGRSEAWEKVAQTMQLDIHECKYRWKILRDRFVKECGIIASGKCGTAWEYYQQLEFLTDHIRPKASTLQKMQVACTPASPEKFQVLEYDDIDDTKPIETFFAPDKDAKADFESMNADDLPNSPTNESSSFRFDYSPENDTIPTEIDLTSSSASSPVHNDLSTTDNQVFTSFLKNVEHMAEKRLRNSTPKHQTKHQAFFNLAAEKLDQLSWEDQEEAQLFFLGYLHKKIRLSKKRRKN